MALQKHQQKHICDWQTSGLAWHLLQGSTLHVDETPVVQLDPNGGKTRSQTASGKKNWLFTESERAG
ncbi:hypothetical protein NSMM_400107 [Nitrosomonas mobilis]|uniref:Uncharacterized protein n=1 Tax=Nitrosomonas mobilis TaxID=51642 RepID=A0A1G5SGW0_9PROT|nr:hypothetical protein NSMM_400107 [Nitrosomonas mobilis]